MFPDTRSAGILCHITSLPGKHGIGDLGHGADLFLDALQAANQHYWQILPTGPTAQFFGNSPYAALSSWAGNPLLLSLDLIRDMGLLDATDLNDTPRLSEYQVDFHKVAVLKKKALERAHLAFQPQHADGYGTFVAANADWLKPYALFQAQRARHQGISWERWPATHGGEKCPSAACPRCRDELADQINFHCFVQYLFDLQWRRLRQRAHRKKIALVGDIPYYTAFDSADCWSAPHLFQLDAENRPTAVAGVPPDYFSATGQRWGNPLYRWFDRPGILNRELVGWWRSRLQQALFRVDLLRIDHFRGFESYWAVPADHDTAIHGSWQKGPGASFFQAIQSHIPLSAIIAEDLGIITPEVDALRDTFRFPGMKVLQFAFDGNPANSHLPQNFNDTRTVVYTGTHDNDTTLGWYMDPATGDGARNQLHRLTGTRAGDPVHRAMIRLAYGSTARLAIVPVQDLLGFGSDCRMNRPGTAQNNWQWRLAPRFLQPDILDWLADQVLFFNRNHPPPFATPTTKEEN